MTGPEHYKEAERLLTEHEYSSSADALAAAQVHATLALAAATAGGRVIGQHDGYNFDGAQVDEGWQEVLS